MVARLDRAFLRVSGPDAIGFLDNLLTQDVTRLAREPVLYAALLSPQGKLITDMLLWSGGDWVAIDVAPARKDDLLRRLTMYKLRAQVTVEDASDQFFALYDTAFFEGAFPDPRLPALGWRNIVGGTDFPIDASRFDAHRIALGVPDLSVDAQPEEVFGLEALLDELNGVDLKKGCFVGQENVSRMKRRATTRKKFCPIVFEGAALPFGAPVRAGEAEIGSVRSSVDGRALALLRLDRAQEAIGKGIALSVADIPVRLDPPAWLLMPSGDGE